MKLGVLPSYRTPDVADPDHVAAFARILEDAGAESVWAVEHMVVPRDYASRYPYAPDGRMPLAAEQALPDPLDWLAFVAGVTSRLRLATGVIILPQHNPVQLAKRLATIDALSRGRLTVGVGVGWLREEAEVVGTSFDDRGARADEHIATLRAVWGDRLEGSVSRPLPVQPGGIPVVVGGHSRAAARRAGRLGDGLYALGVGAERLGELVDHARSEARAAGRDPHALEVTANVSREPDEAKRLRDLGVSRLVAAAPADLDAARKRVGELVAMAERL